MWSVRLQQLVSFVSDRASSIKGIHEDLYWKLHLDAPHLLEVHYLAHRETLSVNYASSHFQGLQYIDKFANKVYSWLGKSTKIHGKLKELMYSF